MENGINEGAWVILALLVIVAALTVLGASIQTSVCAGCKLKKQCEENADRGFPPPCHTQDMIGGSLHE